MKQISLTHLDRKGDARMVGIGAKPETRRLARAQGSIRMQRETLNLVLKGDAKKGDVLAVARIAGIQAAKRTSEFIPLCHSISLTSMTIDFKANSKDLCITATCTAETIGRTGVEMEALTGVSLALLTIYDMCEAVDRGMTIFDISLAEKLGGKSGHFLRPT